MLTFEIDCYWFKSKKKISWFLKNDTQKTEENAQKTSVEAQTLVEAQKLADEAITNLKFTSVSNCKVWR